MDNNIIKVTIEENEGIVDLLNRMLNLKKESNNDVVCELNGQLLTTEGCNNIKEAYVKNDNVILSELEKDRNEVINEYIDENLVERFRLRGKKYDSDNQENRKIASELRQLESEFEKKIRELNNLDYNKPSEIYNWIISIEEYINNADLYLPLGLDKSEYKSYANYIVEKLKEKGYTTAPENVNNIDDHYKKLIKYELDDLSKYGFFAYTYADKLRYKKQKEEKNESEIVEAEIDMVEENTEINRIQTRILELDKEIEKITRNIEFLQLTENGSLNRKTRKKSLSFDKRKEKISEEIAELEKIEVNTTDIKELYNDAHNEILKYPINENILEAYYAATEVPDNNRITKALEEAFKLPTSDLSRLVLIDAIEKLNFRYNGNEYNDVALIDNKNTLARIKEYKQDTFTEVEKAVLAQYDTLNQNSSQNDIISVLESIIKLPKTSEIKKPLLDIVQNMNKSIIETGMYENTINKQKVLELKSEYDKIEAEAQETLMLVSPLLIEAKSKQTKLIEEREELKQQISNNLTSSKSNDEKELDLSLFNMVQNNNISNNEEVKQEKNISQPGFKMYDLKEGQTEKSNENKELDLSLFDTLENSNTKEVEKDSPLYKAVMGVIAESEQKSNEMENEQTADNKIENAEQETESNDTIEQNTEEKVEEDVVDTQHDTLNQNNESNNNEESTQENSNTEQSNDDFIAKLESMGRISTDLERRLSKEDSWMEVNTANYLNKLEEKEVVEPSQEEVKKDEKPHKITEIKKAGAKLLDKIKESKFVQIIKHALEVCKKNKEAIAFTAAFVGMAIVGGLINSNDKTAEPIVPDSTIETNTDKDMNQDFNNIKIDTDSVTVEVENPDIEEVETTTLADSVEMAKESILSGSEVYSNVVDANQETNGLLPTDQQLENSWNNSEVGAYYTLTDNGVEQLTNEEAKVAFNDGEQVIARLDNQNTPIGFVPLETSEKGISR